MTISFIKQKKHPTILAILSVLFLSNLTEMVRADTQIDKQNSSADAFINVVAPTSNPLYLDQNPSFVFAAGEIKQNSFSMNATGDSAFRVVNLTGTNTNYALQETISNFTAPAITGNGTSTLPVTGFYLSVENSADGNLTGCQNVNILGQSGQVLTTTSNGSSTGRLTSGKVSANMTIDGKQANIQKGEYRATITTTLVAGV